jgi:hypothetical protein
MCIELLIIKQDEQVYDALARSASGSFLRKPVSSNQKWSDYSRARWCAFSRVREVRWVSAASVLSDSTEAVFELNIRWEVTGTVEHWGHIHTREHAYDALIQVIAEGRANGKLVEWT